MLAQHEPDLQMGRVGCVQVEAREPCNSGVVLLRPNAAVFRTIGQALERIAQVRAPNRAPRARARRRRTDGPATAAVRAPGDTRAIEKGRRRRARWCVRAALRWAALC